MDLGHPYVGIYKAMPIERTEMSKSWESIQKEVSRDKANPIIQATVCCSHAILDLVKASLP